jgi:HlyD family secretion protein
VEPPAPSTAPAPAPAPRRRILKRAALALALIALAAYFGRNALLGTPVETVEVVRADLVQTVVASGRVMSPRRVHIGAVITGRVVGVPVAEGQTVKKGDELVLLDDKDVRAALLQAQAGVSQAEAKLRQLREVGLPAAQQGLLQAEATLTQVRGQFDRTKRLQAQGFVGQSQLDDAQRNLDVAESQARAARVQVETNSARGSDFAMAMTALEQARASERVAQARLPDTVIRAPVDGILISRSVEAGDTVQPGKELFSLAPAGDTQVIVQIDERNLAQLAPGQKALGSADAFPGRRFPAELIYINPGIDALRGSVEVRLRVPAPPDYLRQDMTVSVDIEVARRSQAVVAPTEAVRDATTAQPWVLAVRSGRTERVPVKVGLRGDGRLEVLEGAAPGDTLVPATNGLITAGQRVRATPRPTPPVK